MMTGRFPGFPGFLLFPLARFLVGPFGMARPHPCASPGWVGSPSAARIRFRAASTCFLPGSEMPLALQLSAQMQQPGIQSKGRATIGLPVARSHSKTPAGQKLRQSKSRRHTWELMIGNQKNRSRRLRIVGTAFSPKLIRNRIGPPKEALSGAFLWACPVLLLYHAAVLKSLDSLLRAYPGLRYDLERES